MEHDRRALHPPLAEPFYDPCRERATGAGHLGAPGDAGEDGLVRRERLFHGHVVVPDRLPCPLHRGGHIALALDERQPSDPGVPCDDRRGESRDLQSGPVPERQGARTVSAPARFREPHSAAVVGAEIQEEPSRRPEGRQACRDGGAFVYHEQVAGLEHLGQVEERKVVLLLADAGEQPHFVARQPPGLGAAVRLQR